MDEADKQNALRLDKWLWFVRLAKTRNLAQRQIEEGVVSINGFSVQKTGAPLKIGDKVLTVQGKKLRLVSVKSLPERRLAAAEARFCYEDVNLDRQGAVL